MLYKKKLFTIYLIYYKNIFTTAYEINKKNYHDESKNYIGGPFI